ncbi:hypothetical protein HaLaN_20417 [Haematococcus lacustris]|uniref:Uncharacterized protein n=1 Tax=Haematococcus lacustris TaxID=44745 RepID=A0A699ZT84_HAELA|nr:hypothetical protein HaLaN_20417 [Haematococcus lacustris]
MKVNTQMLDVTRGVGGGGCWQHKEEMSNRQGWSQALDASVTARSPRSFMNNASVAWSHRPAMLTSIVHRAILDSGSTRENRSAADVSAACDSECRLGASPSASCEASITLLAGSRIPAGPHSLQAHKPAQSIARKSSEAPVGVASEECFSPYTG